MRKTILCSLLLFTPAVLFAGETELLRALEDGDLPAMRAETAEPATLDQHLPPLGLTPLAIAAIRGHADLVADLLARGADPNARFFRGQTALTSAARTCTVPLKVFTTLIDAGAAVDARSGARLTPAMSAIAVGRPDIANLLLDRGADPHAVTMFGDGLLAFADTFGAPDLASRLESAGVDPAQRGGLFRNRRYYSFDFDEENRGIIRSICQSRGG